MFVPDLYRPQDPSWALDVVRANPLATLVVNGPREPFVTHLPVIPAEDTLAAGEGDCGLVGVTLLGHLNRSNPHWATVAGGADAVLVFQGPHGYVSPTVYRTTPAAPTWNFVSVHVHGRLEPLEAGEQTLGVVRETVRIFERDLGTGWDMTDSVPYFERIAPGVGAFRFTVTAAEGMFKLSQEKTPEVRKLVADGFTASGRGPHRELADAMHRFG
ncbi:FMN-binding negative transcriptional regulator [Kitasatospora purpeofusca]|uniref:FMN-binding negative transcriptional regulator n=1 Tax=Kitasatospora purpeofusca TaxID=67352 RepID=A0ABZ1U5A8_9ACTN|nr:FMN-binding negative transcriptional regulator [Kitasatospora purpeofusca]